MARLSAAGCIAADEEADLLLDAAGGSSDVVEELVVRREAGEPVEWIVGWTAFCGVRLTLRPGVYVPRPQTELLARRAVVHLPEGGVAVELGTGSGAISVVLAVSRPGATVVATEVDPRAAGCAGENGVHVLPGDLDAPLPLHLCGGVDVLVANLPYVPTAAMSLLPRDVREHEPIVALDGGADGLDLVRRAISAAPRWLRPGGWILLEVGGDQEEAVRDALRAGGFGRITVLRDANGDPRGVEARMATRLETPAAASKPM